MARFSGSILIAACTQVSRLGGDYRHRIAGELDDALGLTTMAGDILADARTGNSLYARQISAAFKGIGHRTHRTDRGRAIGPMGPMSPMPYGIRTAQSC
jgi:hypothetical protein